MAICVIVNIIGDKDIHADIDKEDWHKADYSIKLIIDRRDGNEVGLEQRIEEAGSDGSVHIRDGGPYHEPVHRSVL